MADTLKDIKSIALQMEMDGIKFYSDLANKTLHPMGRAMFKSFVEDEKLHAKRIRLLLSSPPEIEKKDGKNPQERLSTIFREMGEELKKKVNVNTNDIEAVRLALKIEEDGIRFYEKAVKDTTDGKEREMYRFLAGEEKVHLGILKNTLEYLENTELWDAEDTGRIYDMWMNMVNKMV
ncbi:MAG TPA: ferritin-like domain-containing protein [Candidatus Brocadiaceae bacterium]